MIEQNEKTFTVKIPILTKQTTVMEQQQIIMRTMLILELKRVEELKGFYGNLISYCCVIPFLILSTSNFHHNFIGFGFRL
jgi:hypothetical protein